MKLVLVKNGDSYTAFAADEIKLINKEVMTIPKEIKMGDSIIPVVDLSEIDRPAKISTELIIAHIKEIMNSGDGSEMAKINEFMGEINSKNSESPNEISEGIYKGLKEILESINDFKKTTVAKLDSNLSEITTSALPETSDQLQAIVNATESATNTIIDTTEKIQENSREINSQMQKIKELKDQLERGLVGVINVMDSMEKIRFQNDAHLMRILESLSFQDITGQRIYKIVEIVSKMDKNIKEIVLDLGLKLKKKTKDADPATIKKGEELLALMKGPQENGINQNEIDDIISKFL